MTTNHWRIARTQRDLDESQRLRWQCLVEERSIALSATPQLRREVSCFDALETTRNVLAYAHEEAVGTVRLALPAGEALAGPRRNGELGLELEQAFELHGFDAVRDELGEVSRFCVRASCHGSSAVTRLYEGLYVVSRELGLRYWVGGVDCQTACREEAFLMRGVLEQRGLIAERFSASPVSRGPTGSRPGGRPSSLGISFYSAAERARAAEPRSPRTRIAPRLETFVRRLGARCIGVPVLHPTFDRYVMPMVVELDEIPPNTLARFDATLIAPELRQRPARLGVNTESVGGTQ